MIYAKVLLRAVALASFALSSMLFSLTATADSFREPNRGWGHHPHPTPHPNPPTPKCLSRNAPSEDYTRCCSGLILYWNAGIRHYCTWSGAYGYDTIEFNANQIGSSLCILPPPEYGITANQWVCR